MKNVSIFSLLPIRGVLKVSRFHGTNIEGAVAIPFDSEETRARLALMMAQEAIEHAGYSASDFCSAHYLAFEVEAAESWESACKLAHATGVPVRYPSDIGEDGNVDIPSFWTDSACASAQRDPLAS